MALSTAFSSASSSRLAACNLPRCPASIVVTHRALSVCYARSGYEQRPETARYPARGAPNSGGWEDDFATDEMATSPRASGADNTVPNRQPGGYGGQEGRPQRRQYNNNNQEGGEGGERRQYYSNNQEGGEGGQRRPYNNNRQYYSNNQEGGEGGQRRQYNNNNNNQEGGEGGQRRQYNNNNQEGGEGGQRRQYNNRPYNNNNNRYNNQEGGGRYQDGGPRQTLSPEQYAAREEVKFALREARGWRALSQVMTDKGPQLDAENIGFIFQKVARESRQQQQDPQDAAEYDQLLSTLLGWVLSLRPTFRPKHTAQVLSSLGKLQLYSPEVVTALVEQATAQMGNFNEQELAQVLIGIGMLGQAPTPAFMEQLEGRTGGVLSRMKIADLVGIMSALHRLNVLPVGKPWLDSAMAALESQCMQLPVTQDDAKALQRPRGGGGQYGDAQEGEAAPPPQRRNFQARNPLDIMLNEYMDACMLLANLAQDTGYQAPQSLVDALMSRQVWRVAYPPLDMATRLLWVVSNLTARPSREWFVSLMTGLERKDRYWVPSEVSNFCLYLSRYLQQQATPNLARKLWRFAEAQKAEMGADGVASVLYFLAMSGYKPQERWLDDVLIWLKPQLPTCSLTGLELIYNSLPLLGSGFRLNEVLTEAANRYNAAVEGQQQQGGGEEAQAGALEAAVA